MHPVYMRDYGIKMTRPWWKSLIAHLPLVNRFYFLKVRIVVDVLRNKSTLPVEGVFRETWIPKRTTDLKIQFATLKSGDSIHVSVYSLNYNYKNTTVEYESVAVKSEDWRDLDIKVKFVKDNYK